MTTKGMSAPGADPEYLRRLEEREAAAVFCSNPLGLGAIVSRQLDDELMRAWGKSGAITPQFKPWSRRRSFAMLLAAALLLWGVIWLAISVALAGQICTRIGNTVYCNDDRSTRTSSCSYVAGSWYCN